jgi:hypothetical protein
VVLLPILMLAMISARHGCDMLKFLLQVFLPSGEHSAAVMPQGGGAPGIGAAKL